MLNAVLEDLKRQYYSGNILTRIIIVNLGVFVFFRMLWLILFLVIGNNSSSVIGDFLDWFSISSNLFEVITRPWTILSHMFLHFDFWHFLWNVLFLYWFGRILQDMIGNHRILPIYVISGLAGALAFFLGANFIPHLNGGYALGASAAIMGVILAAATISPNYSLHLILIGPVRLVYVALFIVFLDLISIPTMNNTGGHLAHLGGAFMGWFLARQMQNGKDWTEGFNRFVDKITDWVSGLRKRPRPSVAYKNPNLKKSEQQQKANELSRKERQEKVDKILEKIKQLGYENLTDEEKEFLFRVSREE